MSGQKKQIEEMAWEICDIPRHDSYKSCKDCNCYGKCHAMYYAKRAYEAGYRKQREGERIVCGMFDDFLKCSVCGDKHPWQTAIEYRFCPNCGAKMKGGERE